METAAHHYESSSEEEQEVKPVELGESVNAVHQVALWHAPHISSEQHDGPTSQCPWDDYKSRGTVPPMFTKWLENKAREPALDEAHPILDKLQVLWNNYSVTKMTVQGKIIALVKATHNIIGMYLDDACSTVEQECERSERQIEHQLSV
jgi:hypothetical protein